MRRIDLVAVTLERWGGLNPQQRERFFQAGLGGGAAAPTARVPRLVPAAGQDRTALGSDRSGALCYSDRDMALLLKQLPLGRTIPMAGPGCRNAHPPVFAV